jgi:hypothetical protein
VLAAAVLLAAPDEGDFNALVKGIESQYGIKRTRIPFFGVAKLFVKVARPEGVKQFDLAVFEDSSARPDQRQIDKLVRKAAGEGWKPMVRVRSRAGDESTYVYSKPAGHDISMLVAVFDSGDAVVMKYRVDAVRFMRMLDDPDRIGRDR